MTAGERKTAVVTGGTSGIGLAIAMDLARRDFEVDLWARRTERGEEALRAVKGVGRGSTHFQACDVASAASIRTAVEAFERRADHLDVLVNAAGILRREMLGALDAAAVSEQIDTLLTGTILVTNALASRLARARQSIVVNIGSVAGREPFGSLSAYGAAKAGVAHFTRVAAKELFASGVRVICVCPGVVRTSLMDEVEFAMVRRSLPGRRLQSVEEVTALVGHLVTEDFPSLTGAVIDLDDGISLFTGGPESKLTGGPEGGV